MTRRGAAVAAMVAAGMAGAAVLGAAPGSAGAGTFPGENGLIAYTGADSVGGDDEIYTIPRGGGTPTNVTDNATDDTAPDW